MSIEAMKLALECMEAAIKAGDWKVDGACDPDYVFVCLRAAIEQAEKQEPVAWMRVEDLKAFQESGYTESASVLNNPFGSCDCLPLYIAPPQREPIKYDQWAQHAYTKVLMDQVKDLSYKVAQREWQGLTDEELLDIADMAYSNDLELLQTLQTKLKEKNF